MMTSRSEYRLIIRQDNAPERLTELGHDIGLISEERYAYFLNMKHRVEQETARIKKTSIEPSEELNAMLESVGTSPITQSVKLIELVKRPQVSYRELMKFDKTAGYVGDVIAEKVDVNIKYEGYIRTQLAKIKEMKRLECKALPSDIDYEQISGLRLEAREKLNLHKPLNIGQASRISGVNPADISVLLIWLAANNKGGDSDE